MSAPLISSLYAARRSVRRNGTVEFATGQLRASSYPPSPMFAYWVLFLIFAIGALWSQFQTKNTRRTVAGSQAYGAWVATPHPRRDRNLLLFLAATLATLFVGLRYEVGTDWENYLDIFKDAGRASFFKALDISDPAYAALNWFTERLGADIWLVNLACAALLMFGVVRFAKTQPNAWLAIAVAVPYLIIVVGMGYTRQSVAIGLGMVGLAAASRGSVRDFLIWVLLAALFHRSAVILVPLVGLAYSRNRFQTVILTATACVIGYFILVGGTGLEEYQRLYINRVYESHGAGVRLAMNVPPALMFLLWRKRFVADPIQSRLWSLFAWLAVANFAAWLFIPSSTPVDRVGLYILPLQVVVLSRLPFVFGRDGRSSTVLTAGVLAYSAVIQLTWFNYAFNARSWVPYHLWPIFE